MRDDCDYTGIWHVDFEIARVYVDPSVDMEQAKRYFGSQIIVIDKFTWWLPEYFFDNLGRDPHSSNRVFLKAVPALAAFGIDPFNIDTTPRQRPVNWAVVEDKDKEEVKDKDNKEVESKKKSKPPKIEIVLPFDSPEFADKWGQWLAYKAERRESYKGPRGMQATLNRLASIGEQRAIAAIDHSMGMTWAGIYEEKQPMTAHGKVTNSNQAHIHNLASSFAARHATGGSGNSSGPGVPTGG